MCTANVLWNFTWSPNSVIFIFIMYKQVTFKNPCIFVISFHLHHFPFSSSISSQKQRPIYECCYILVQTEFRDSCKFYRVGADRTGTEKGILKCVAYVYLPAIKKIVQWICICSCVFCTYWTEYVSISSASELSWTFTDAERGRLGTQ